MRVSREQAVENRGKVVETAARLFRERGVGGVGLAEVMREAGLTHGGFYGQFGSKEELVAEACAWALDRSAAKWRRVAAAHADDPVAAIADFYLTPAHRDGPGNGCAAAALAGDMAQAGVHARQAYTQGVRDLAAVLAAASPEPAGAGKERDGLATLSLMVGALVLARAVDDEALSQEILAAARERTGAPAAD